MEPHVEICGVQLSGHGSRMREPLLTSFAEVVDRIAQAIAPLDDRPFAFFGHSLGGLLAFEVARLGARLGLPAPKQLFLSGCEPAAHHGPGKALHLMPDAELADNLRDFNGTPPEVLRNGELMALLLPSLRTDFALAHGYQYRVGLRCAWRCRSPCWLAAAITTAAASMSESGPRRQAAIAACTGSTAITSSSTAISRP